MPDIEIPCVNDAEFGQIGQVHTTPRHLEFVSSLRTTAQTYILITHNLSHKKNLAVPAVLRSIGRLRFMDTSPPKPLEVTTRGFLSETRGS